MPVLFSTSLYQINISMTNDCVSVIKALAMGVQLMTGRLKYTHIKCKGQRKDEQVSPKEFMYFRSQK